MKPSLRLSILVCGLALLAFITVIWLRSAAPAPEPSHATHASRSADKSERDAVSDQLALGLESPPKTPARQAPSTKLRKDASEFERFNEWAARYVAANEEQRSELLDEGLEIAQVRRAALRQLIETDPRRAIENAVPPVLRQQLPTALVERLEERVNEEAFYGVLGAVPSAENPETPAYRREVRTSDGGRYRAFVYGQRLSQPTTEKASIVGIAVDDMMAIDERPLRTVASGEIPNHPNNLTRRRTVTLLDEQGFTSGRELQTSPAPPREVVETCPVSGEATAKSENSAAVTEKEVVVEAGGQFHYLCRGGHIVAFEEQLLSREGGNGGPVMPTSPPSATQSTGYKTNLLMRVAFPEALKGSVTEKEGHDLGKNVQDWFIDNSYGAMTFMTTVTPLIVLPRSEAWYKDQDTSGSAYEVLWDARTAAKAAGFDPANYNFDTVIYTGTPGGFGGQAYVGGKGCWLKSGTGTGVAAHEYGHNFGLWHANFWTTTNGSAIGGGSHSEYGDSFDTMGSASAGDYHFNACHKNQLGWLPTSLVHDVTTSGTYRIYQMDQPAQNPRQRYAIKTRKDADRDYWVDLRQLFTSNAWVQGGVFLHWSPWALSEGGAHLLDTTPGSIDAKTDAPIVIGRTFSDPETGIHITPIAKNATTPPSADVVVNLGLFPGNNAPVVAVGASATSALVNVAVNLTATASDIDGDVLSYAWDFGDKSFSTTNSAVVSKSWAAAGDFRVRCTASDMKGKTASASVIVTVGSPGTFRIAGTITAGGLPLADVRVHNSLTGSSYREAYTDADGAYTLTRLSAGTYTVATELYGYTLTPTGSASVTVGPNKTLNFTAADQPQVSIVVQDADCAEGANTGTFRISRTGSTAAALTVSLYAPSGSAAKPADYSLAPDVVFVDPLQTLTIPAGQAFLDVVVTAANDTGTESFESVILELVPSTSYVIGTGTATLWIADGDTTNPLVRLLVADRDADESGDEAQFVIERIGSTTAALNVVVALSGTATNGTDYATISTTVTIPAGAASVPVNVTPLQDTTVETMETVILTISTNAAYTRPASSAEYSGTVNLHDDDQPILTVAATDSAAAEASSDPGVFTVTRTGDTSQSLTVNYGLTGSALHGTDYLALPGVLIISAGSASGTVVITPIDDAIGEPAQTVVFQLRGGIAYTVGAASNATVTVTDNSDVPYASIAVTTGPAIEGGTTGIFRVTTTGTGSGNINVLYTVTGTATSGTDYTTLSGTLSIGKNTTGNISIATLQDTTVEGYEIVTVTLTPDPAYSLAVDSSATMNLQDDDAPQVNVSTTDDTFSESNGSLAKFFVSRTGSTTNALTVNYTLSGTATSGVDYTAPSGSVTIGAGATGAFVDVSMLADALAEGTETITLTITPSGSYSAGFGAATRYITDAQSASVATQVRFSASSSSAGNAGLINIPVTLSAAAAGTVTVEYIINGGTALAGGVDYQFTPGMLTFAPGEIAKSIPVTILPDTVTENNETIIIALVNPGNAKLGTSSHTVTITSDAAVATNTVTVTSPNGGESVYFGATQNITWSASITGNVKIDLFKAGSLHSVLSANEANDGVYSWSVPESLPAGSDYTIKISSVDTPAYTDTSDATFSILVNPLATALDTTGLSWSSSGDAIWFAQSTTTHDGIDAAQSGAMTDNQSSSLETTLTGPGTLTFWWKVSSEPGYDYLTFYINDVEQTGSLAKIAGTVDWVQKTVSIPSGTQTVKWTYSKDFSVSTGSDAAWVDQVVFSAAEIAVEQPVGTDLVDGSATIDSGSISLGSSSSPITVTVRNTGTANLTGLALTKDGTHNADFTLGSLGATTLAPAASTTFTVTFSPGATGARTAAVHIANSDADENPFDIALTGTGVPLGTLAVTPAGGLTSTGSYGGAFSPTSQVYTLTNSGSTSINWTAAKTAAWIDLSATSGTLAAGANTTVTVSFNSNANALAIGSYSDTVTFTNTTNANGNTTRGVSLTVNGAPATVNLSNLLQTYDGTPKPITVTTTPAGLSNSVTYAGSATVPTNAGSYAVVATVTDPNYTGSASSSLTISKAAQTISFAALDPVLDSVPSITLTATASSGLAVAYASSNTAVATVSGSTVTIVGLGTTTITALQIGDSNYNAATSVPQTLTVVRSNPLAVTGGPYKVLLGQTLSLNGSASQPSYGETISTYEWDLNNDNTFGDATGATPSAISFATLTSTWGMVSGLNTIKLKITDSASKTSIISTTLELVFNLTWDANSTTAGQTNGAGAWLGSNLWWDGAANQTWAPGSNATFGGPNTAGGAVTLASPTTVNAITFNTFTGTYTLGTAGQALTISGGITKSATSAAVSFVSPITLGTAQTWINNSSGTLTTSTGTSLIDNAGYSLTVDGTGNTTFGIINTAALALTGSGALVKNGASLLSIGGLNSGFTGTVTINGGVLRTYNDPSALGNGNVTLNGGTLEFYWGVTYIRALGAGVGQVQIPDGMSGFSQNGNNGVIRLNNNTAFEAVWGSTYFNPSEFILNASTAQAGASMTFDNPIDLNGSTRVIRSDANTTAVAVIARVIRTSTGTAGLTKTGLGIIALSAANTYNGNTTISGGTLRIGNNTAGTLGNGNYAGNISIASGASLQVWSTTAQTLSGVISGAGALQKAYGGALTLSGPNTYSGKTSFLPQTTAGFTVNVSSFNSVNGGIPLLASSSLGAPTTIPNGTIDLGSGSAQAAVTLNYTGAVETTDRVINLGFNGTASQTISASGSGLLKFTSAMTSNAAAQTGQLILSGTGSGEITQALPALPTGGLAKTGAGTWTLSGPNTYAGPTTITAGKLALGASNVMPNTTAVSIGAATLDAVTYTDTLGTLDVTAAAIINLGSGAALAFADSSAVDWTGGTLNITGTFVPGSSLRFGTSSTGLTATQLTKITVAGYSNFFLDANGYLTVDNTPPTLASSAIVDDKGGAPIIINTPVIYTVTFSEDMEATSVTATDFGNAGSASVTMDSVTETSPGVFTVQATPTTAGTLQLRVNQNAVLKDVAGNNLNTASAIPDDTILIVNLVPQTITFGALPAKTFGNAPFSLTGSASSGLAVSYDSSNTAVATISGSTVTIVGAGSATITAFQAGDINYAAAPSVPQTLTVAPASQAITFAALPAKTFGDVPMSLTATASTGLAVSYASSNEAVATVSGSTVTIVGAGSTTITASQAGNTNYAAAPSVPQTLTVAQASQTLTFAALPLKAFGDAPFALTGSASSGLVVSYASSNTAVATISGSTVTIVGAGSATITASQAGDINYTAATSVPQTLTVDGTLPTLSSITDDKSGGPILISTLVTYTFTFSETMDTGTVAAADFGNAGTAAVTIGTVIETSPGVFNVQATPTGAGTLQLKINAAAVLKDLAGNNLDTIAAIADDTIITVDGTAPTLAGGAIVDDKSGGPVMVNTLVTYTVTFSEDMDAASVSGDDFGNAGSATVTIGTVIETSAGVFTVQATPVSTGTLQLKINAAAVLKDVAGNNLDTAIAIADDTTITVDGTAPTLAGSAIVDNQSGAPITSNTLVIYTVTFSEDMDAATVTAGDFGNAGSAALTIGTVTETSPGVFTVQATPTSAGTLQLRVNAAAVLKDFAGNALVTTSAISDDTTITVNAVGSYATWGSINAPTGTAANDFDGDGVSNGVEYVLGGTKDSKDADILPQISNSGNNVLVTFKRDQTSINPSTTLVIEVGTNLSAWPTIYTVPDNAVANNPGVTVVKNSPPGFDSVTLTLSKTANPIGFARLKVTTP